MRRAAGMIAIAAVVGLCSGCAATRMAPAELATEKNPRIMGVITSDGETIRFDRQRDTITWRADTLRVASRDTTVFFARDRIREVLVDKGATARMLVAAVPIALLMTVVAALWNMGTYT